MLTQLYRQIDERERRQNEKEEASFQLADAQFWAKIKIFIIFRKIMGEKEDRASKERERQRSMDGVRQVEGKMESSWLVSLKNKEKELYVYKYI